MGKQNFNEIHLSGLGTKDPCSITNFIVSDGKTPSYFSLEDPFIFDGIVLGLCIQGKGLMRIGFKEYELVRGTILTILPKHLFKVIEQSDDFILETLFFSFDFISGLPFPNEMEMFLMMGHMPCINVDGQAMHNLINHHAFIVNKYNGKHNPLTSRIIRGLLYSLMLEICSLYGEMDRMTLHTAEIDRSTELAEKFFEILMKEYKKERSVAYYASKLCITTKYLSFIVKKVTGYPVMKWIDEIMITEIKIMLKTSNMTVLQISEELNFPNPSFFGRYFKKHTGMTPAVFRKS